MHGAGPPSFVFSVEAASIGGGRRHFNARPAAVLALALALAACKDEEPPVTPAADAAVRADEAPPPPVPIPPRELLAHLPRPPVPAAAAPGAAAAPLRKARPGLRPSIYTDRILQEILPPGGAFARVAYQLGGGPPRKAEIDAVLMTFTEPYHAPAHWEALRRTATDRLGEGEPFRDPPYEGVRWTVPGYRVELRIDTVTGDRQLLFHRRGGRDLGLP